jgi:hypothetical protein
MSMMSSSRLMVAVLAVFALALTGCNKDDRGESGQNRAPVGEKDAGRTTSGVSGAGKDADVCTHCPGIQKANAAGMCEECAVKGAAGEDVCTHCEGVQKANAEGKCPVCTAKKASSGVSGAGAAVNEAVDVCTHCPGTQAANADGECADCAAKEEAGK